MIFNFEIRGGPKSATGQKETLSVFLPGQKKHSAELAINFEIRDGTEIGLEEAGIHDNRAKIGLEGAEIGDRAKINT